MNSCCQPADAASVDTVESASELVSSYCRGCQLQATIGKYGEADPEDTSRIDSQAKHDIIMAQ